MSGLQLDSESNLLLLLLKRYGADYKKLLQKQLDEVGFQALVFRHWVGLDPSSKMR